MLRLSELRRGTANGASRIHQFLGVKSSATGVTLVASSASVLTVRASALHVTVWQVPITLRAVGQQHIVSIDKTLIVKSAKDFVDYRFVVLSLSISE